MSGLSVQIILRARGQREGERKRSRCLNRCLDSRHRVFETIDGAFLAAGGVFDRAADNACRRGESNRLGCGGWVVTKSVLQIGVDRQISSRRKHCDVLENAVAPDRVVAHPD